MKTTKKSYKKKVLVLAIIGVLSIGVANGIHYIRDGSSKSNGEIF